jgi:hypothetical protein
LVFEDDEDSSRDIHTRKERMENAKKQTQQRCRESRRTPCQQHHEKASEPINGCLPLRGFCLMTINENAFSKKLSLD